MLNGREAPRAAALSLRWGQTPGELLPTSVAPAHTQGTPLTSSTTCPGGVRCPRSSIQLPPPLPISAEDI